MRWFTDNQNVARILLVGSRKELLQKEACAIFALSIANKIRIEPEWIPRAENQLADYLSKIVDHDDWQIHPSMFEELDRDWGPHTVDRFASYYNTHLPRFNSRFWNPGTEAVDAFTCDWHGEVNWWCPPPYLVPRTIKHAQRSGVCGTLLVPEWKSAAFWPLLFPDGASSAWFVREVRVFDKDKLVVCAGRNGANLFRHEPNTNMLALRVSFQK